MWFKQNKWKIIVPLLVVVILAGAFWYGGGAPGLQGWTVGGNDRDDKQTEVLDNTNAPHDDKEADKDGDQNAPAAPANDQPTEQQPEDKPDTDSEKPRDKTEGLASRPGGAEGGMTAAEKVEAAKALAGGSGNTEAGDKEYAEQQGMQIDEKTGKDKYLTDPVPDGKPIPVEPQDVKVTDVAHTCTLSVSCQTILDNMDWLDPMKHSLVPEDGVIFPATSVTFYEGESVFNLLQREMKAAGIHMEFQNTPMYNSAYIEGINNLYEFDCGDLSGWMYKVNGWFPNYGCSRYQLQEGDVVEWVYTCNLGVDVGGYSALGG